MTTRKIEVFSANCPICEEALETVQRLADSNDTVQVQNVNEPAAAERASALGVRSIPAVAVDDKLAACCTDRGIDEDVLRAAGLGQA